METRFVAMLASLGIAVDARMLERFRTYFAYLEEQNAVMNLTAIGGEDVYRKHFYDSLALLKAGPVDGLALLDVGSGAGFPSLPLAIVTPGLKVTIIDALRKRIDFLDRLIGRLALEGIETVHGRAEEFTRREAFDLVTARAVARLDILAELCLPFVRVGGRFIAMKQDDGGSETAAAAKAIQTLGGKLESIVRYDIGPGEDRILVVVRKTSVTSPKYPRPYAQIKTRPL